MLCSVRWTTAALALGSFAMSCGSSGGSTGSPNGELVPERTTTDAFFGWSVAVSGNDVAAGAPGEADSEGNVGAAYVFQRDATGAWDTRTRLLSPVAHQACGFGERVAISGDYLAVSLANKFCAQAGAVYVYQKHTPDNRWDSVAGTPMQSPMPATGDNFGFGLALDADTLVVATDRHPDPLGGAPFVGGPVYVYRRSADTKVWGLEATLLPDGGYRKDESFGHSVSVSSDDVAIGADDNGTFSTTTAVYLFHRSQAAWKQVVRIQNPIADYTGFGEAVSLRADTLVVGAAEGLNSGSAWLIERDASGAWGRHCC